MTEDTKPPVAEPEKPLPASPLDLPEALAQPDITEQLLNAQLSEALFLLRDAGFLYRNTNADPESRGAYIDQSVRLMSASSTLAEKPARLRHDPGPAETRHRCIVEYATPQGEGGPES